MKRFLWLTLLLPVLAFGQAYTGNGNAYIPGISSGNGNYGTLGYCFIGNGPTTLPTWQVCGGGSALPDSAPLIGTNSSGVAQSVTALPSTVTTTEGNKPVGTTCTSGCAAGQIMVLGSSTGTQVAGSSGLASPLTAFDILAYGAKCDGATDDSAAFQAAVNAIGTAGSGAIVLPGDNRACRIASQININVANIHIRGQGMFASNISVASSTFNLFVVSGTGYVSFEDLTLASFGQSGTSAFYAITDVGGCVPYLTLQNVKIFGFDNGIASCGANFTADNIWTTGPSSTFNATIASTTLTVTSGLVGTISTGSVVTGAGVPVGEKIVSGSGNTWTVSIGATVSSAAAMTAQSGTGVIFSTTSEIKRITRSIINGGFAGIEITGGSAFDLIGNEVQGAGYGLYISPSVVVNSVKSIDDWYDSTKIDAVLLAAPSTAMHRISFTDSWMSSSLGNGLELSGTVLGVQVTGSQIFNNGANGVSADNAVTCTGLSLTGNLIAGNTTDGVFIGSNCSDWSATGNIVGPAADFAANGNGFIIGADSQNNFTVSGNNFTGNTTTNFSNGATGNGQQVIGNLATCQAIGGSICFEGAGGNAATGIAAIAGPGFTNTAFGFHSVSIGGDSNYYSGSYSGGFAGQQANDRGRYNTKCFSSGKFNTQGDMQECEQILHTTAAAASAVRLTADGGTAGSLNCINLPSASLYSLTIDVQVIDHTTPTKSATWNLWTGEIDRSAAASTTHVAMNTTPTPLATGSFAPTISAAADTTNGCLNISVTPPAGNTDTIDMTAKVHTVEVQ